MKKKKQNKPPHHNLPERELTTVETTVFYYLGLIYLSIKSFSTDLSKISSACLGLCPDKPPKIFV